MKVLILTPWWPTRERPWFGNFVQSQAAALLEQGAVVDVVLALPFYARAGQLTRTGIGVGRVVRMPILPRYCAAELLWPLAGSHLRRALGSDFDCMVIHTEVMAAIAGPGAPKPYLVVVHGANTDHRPVSSPTRRRWLLEGLCSARRVIAVGKSLAPWIGERYSFSGPVETIENGYDPEIEGVAAKEVFNDEVLTLSCVGGLDQDKGQRVLIDAGKLVAAGGRRVIVHFVGDGPERQELERRAAGTPGLDVQFHGWRAPVDAARIIGQSDVFVLPSRREALGIVYLNAMALGRPVVGVLGQGIDGLVTNQKDAFLIPPDDPAELARRLLWMIGHPSETRLVAQRGRDLVRSEATWSRNARLLLSLMQGAPTR